MGVVNVDIVPPSPKVSAIKQNQKSVNLNDGVLNMPDDIKCVNFNEQNVTTLAADLPPNRNNVTPLALINSFLTLLDSLPSPSNPPNVHETTNVCHT